MPAEPKWIPFPIFVLSGPHGLEAILPNDQELDMMALRVERQAKKLAAARPPNFTDQQLEAYAPYVVAKAMMTELESQIVDAREAVETRRPEAIKRDFWVAAPYFDEFIEAEGAAKDFVGDRYVVDDGKMMVNLLLGHVKEGDRVLRSIDEFRDLGIGPNIAQRLYNELYARTFPSLELVPFWKRPSSPSEQGL